MEKFMDIKLCKPLAIALVISAAHISSASAGAFLLTEFEYGPTVYADMKTNLEAAGNTVDIVNANTGGSLATALGAKSYDSVFFWDLSGSPHINGDDISAMSTFFGSHKNTVIDSRSYGYYYQGNQSSEVALLQNVATQFNARGGGIWFGTDHDPAWTYNANPILAALGFETVSGSYGDPVNDYDPASVLLAGVTASQLWAAGQTVGKVSLGIQPNGLDMRYHFGHSSAQSGAIPYISANFGTYITDEEDPDDHNPPPDGSVPEPGGLSLIGAGLLGLMAMRRRKSR
jgi:hypothetical protein